MSGVGAVTPYLMETVIIKLQVCMASFYVRHDYPSMVRYLSSCTFHHKQLCIFSFFICSFNITKFKYFPLWKPLSNWTMKLKTFYFLGLCVCSITILEWNLWIACKWINISSKRVKCKWLISLKMEKTLELCWYPF